MGSRLVGKPRQRRLLEHKTHVPASLLDKLTPYPTRKTMPHLPQLPSISFEVDENIQPVPSDTLQKFSHFSHNQSSRPLQLPKLIIPNVGGSESRLRNGKKRQHSTISSSVSSREREEESDSNDSGTILTTGPNISASARFQRFKRMLYFWEGMGELDEEDIPDVFERLSSKATLQGKEHTLSQVFTSQPHPVDTLNWDENCDARRPKRKRKKSTKLKESEESANLVKKVFGGKGDPRYQIFSPRIAPDDCEPVRDSYAPYAFASLHNGSRRRYSTKMNRKSSSSSQSSNDSSDSMPRTRPYPLLNTSLMLCRTCLRCQCFEHRKHQALCPNCDKTARPGRCWVKFSLLL